MTNKIIRNAIQCCACGTVIESTHIHDFKWCNCPPNSISRCAVDGGHQYLKRCGTGDWVELSRQESS